MPRLRAPARGRVLLVACHMLYLAATRLMAVHHVHVLHHPGSDEALAALLPRISIQVAKPGSTIAMPSAPDAPLNLIPTPTPRWPDLLTIYSPQHSMLLSSKLFSAHVSPELAVDDAAAVDAFDAGGWATYARDWRYFFECTLAPVAGQVAAALERLDLQVVPTGTSKTLGLEAGWLVNSFQGLLRGVWGRNMHTMCF